MSFLFESPVKTPKDLPSMKYHPIFDKRWQTTIRERENSATTPSNRRIRNGIARTTGTAKRRARIRAQKPYGRKKLFDSTEQYVLDFGQKNFDAQRCKTCNMLYTVGEIIDEKTHQEYHDTFVNSLRYRDWKNEDIVARFDDGRIVRVLPTSPHYMHRKIDELFKVADIELGINVELKSSMKRSSQYLIFVSLPSKRITGFVAAERIGSANRLLSENPLMASTDEVPAQCGVSRIWTHPSYRRQRIAWRLLDTLRNVFHHTPIPKECLAFSDPTVVGKDFAKNYTGCDHFLIYMYRHVIEELDKTNSSAKSAFIAKATATDNSKLIDDE